MFQVAREVSKAGDVVFGIGPKFPFLQVKSRYFPSPSKKCGVLAQLVERLNGIEEVRGSNPLGSISLIRNGLQRRKQQVATLNYTECEHMRSCLAGPLRLDIPADGIT
jgi:hypothetical protein